MKKGARNSPLYSITDPVTGSGFWSIQTFSALTDGSLGRHFRGWHPRLDSHQSDGIHNPPSPEPSGSLDGPPGGCHAPGANRPGPRRSDHREHSPVPANRSSTRRPCPRRIRNRKTSEVLSPGSQRLAINRRDAVDFAETSDHIANPLL